jgi:hypothetical protein
MTERLPITPSHEHPGSDITGDALEFVRAIEAFQRRYRRRYPSWTEVLHVLRTLGYAKVVPGADYSELKTEHADDAGEATSCSEPRSGGSR